MNTDQRPLLLLAVATGAAVGVAVAAKLRRGRHRAARDLEHARELKSWENEGGNVAPTPAPAVLP